MNRGRGRIVPAGVVILAAVLAISVGCRDPGADTGTDADVSLQDTAPGGPDAGPLYDEAACPNAVVPHRFGFRWEKVNHRVSTWGVDLPAPSGDGCRPRRVRASVVGGKFSTGDADTPTFKFGFQDRTAAGPEMLGFARRRIGVTIPPEGVVTGQKTFAREDLELEHYPRVVALVDGFHFDTDVPQSDEYPDDYDPAHGYTMRGFGVSVGVSERSSDTIEVTYRLHFQTGLSADRNRLNRTIAEARVGGRLDILLAGTSAPVTHDSLDYRVSFPKPETAEEDNFEPPPKKKRRLVLRGRPGSPAGVYGLSSFDFELQPEIDCGLDSDCPAGETCKSDGSCTTKQGKAGFYLRELTVDVRMTRYDRDDGRATFLLTGFASNSSQFVGYWPMTTRFEGGVRWIQTEGASRTLRADRPFTTGTTDFRLLDLAN